MLVLQPRVTLQGRKLFRVRQARTRIERAKGVGGLRGHARGAAMRLVGGRAASVELSLPAARMCRAPPPVKGNHGTAQGAALAGRGRQSFVPVLHNMVSGGLSRFGRWEFWRRKEVRGVCGLGGPTRSPARGTSSV